MSNYLPAWCDGDSFAAATDIADQAQRVTKNINVGAVLLILAHPDAPPAGRWQVMALTTTFRQAIMLLGLLKYDDRPLALGYERGIWSPLWVPPS